MENNTEKTMSNKVASWSIAFLVLAGTLLIAGIADVTEESGMMAKIFLFFLGAVIVVQVIPGLMLFGAILKGIFSLFAKKEKLPEQGRK